MVNFIIQKTQQVFFLEMLLVMYKLGIVLSGGAVRGLAHCGILQALNENGYFPDAISGTSVGAIVGAFYAEGKSPQQILEIFNKENPYRYLKPSLPHKGLINSEEMYKQIDQYLSTERLEHLKIPLFVSTTNLNTGRQTIFEKGSLVKILKASASIPILFNAVEIEGQYYVDGGLLSNFPVEALKDKCKKLIGVNVNPIGYKEEVLKIQDILERTLHLSIWGNTSKNVDEVDIYLEPKKMSDFTLTDPSKMEEAFEAGYKYMKEHIGELEVD